MKMWSVELAANSWNDDTFIGTYEECIEYCKTNDYKIDGEEARLAEVEIEEEIVTYTYDIVNEL